MHKVLNSFKQDLSQKLHKTVINFQKHQKFSKTQDLDLNAWRMRDKVIIPSDYKKGSKITWSEGFERE